MGAHWWQNWNSYEYRSVCRIAWQYDGLAYYWWNWRAEVGLTPEWSSHKYSESHTTRLEISNSCGGCHFGSFGVVSEH